MRPQSRCLSGAFGFLFHVNGLPTFWVDGVGNVVTSAELPGIDLDIGRFAQGMEFAGFDVD